MIDEIQVVAAKPFDWPSGETSQCCCPHCGHADAVQVSAAAEYGLGPQDWSCSNCHRKYSYFPNKAGTLTGHKYQRDTLSYVIKHRYDVGYQGVTISAPPELDVRRAAVYIQFCAEEWYGETAMVTNLGIAAALVTYFGCQHAPMRRDPLGHMSVDMYCAREAACGGAQELLADQSLCKEGLREFLRPHVIVG